MMKNKHHKFEQEQWGVCGRAWKTDRERRNVVIKVQSQTQTKRKEKKRKVYDPHIKRNKVPTYSALWLKMTGFKRTHIPLRST